MSPTSSTSDRETVQEQVVSVMEEMQILGTLDKLVAASEHICIATPLGTGDFLADLQQAFRLNGIETCIKNALVLSRRRKNIKDEQEQLNYMRKAQTHFERRVSKALLNLQTDLKLSLVRQRSSSEAQELSSKWDELSTYDQDVGSIRNLYSSQDLYEAVVALRDPDYSINRLEEKWSAVKIPLNVPTFEDLQEFFSDICTSIDPFLGLGSALVLQGNSNVTLLNHRITLGTKVVAENDILLSEEFIKGGCPSHLRGRLWKQVLLSHVGDKEKTYFQAKKQAVIQTEYLTDKIIMKDIQLTASRDEHYFVYEDLIYQVSLCFSRDPYVCLQLCSKFGSRAQTATRFTPLDVSSNGSKTGTVRADGDAAGGQTVATSAFPPSSCIPFYGWAMYVAPLCYVHEEAEDIYYTLRAMYIKYWSRLHRLSSHGQGIVSLAILFERLLQQQEPELWIHCLNNNIEPLRIAMPWMVQAFSGFLIPEQLLFLWDLILGFDSMLLLPLLAASVFSLRRENLHRILSHDSAETILSDLSTIQVVPLLQMALTQQTG
ncbi:TBC1 domain family member 19-like [Daphnia carinata]|uniref:TBC1 domain family member 19-like n=1 Tax=Daphnia carinata TaxID=120202 RepID=UPI00257F935B|nr:TBC1 domain family member 19-like [Daphnia carinata]